MSRLLLMTASLGPSGDVLPSLGLLAHHVRVLPAEASALLDAPRSDALLVDGSTPEAWAATLPVLRAARRFEVPTIVWGLPATGRAFADVLAVPGEVPPEAARQARPILTTVQTDGLTWIEQTADVQAQVAAHGGGLSDCERPAIRGWQLARRAGERPGRDARPRRRRLTTRP